MTKTKKTTYEETHIEERYGKLFVYIPLSSREDRKQGYCPFREYQRVRITLECVGEDE